MTDSFKEAITPIQLRLNGEIHYKYDTIKEGSRQWCAIPLATIAADQRCLVTMYDFDEEGNLRTPEDGNFPQFMVRIDMKGRLTIHVGAVEEGEVVVPTEENQVFELRESTWHVPGRPPVQRFDSLGKEKKKVT